MREVCVTKETLTREECDLTSVWLLLASPLHPHHSPGSTLKSQRKYHVCLSSPSWPWSQTPDLASNPANPQDIEGRLDHPGMVARQTHCYIDGGEMGDAETREAESNEANPRPTGEQFLEQETPDSWILGDKGTGKRGVIQEETRKGKYLGKFQRYWGWQRPEKLGLGKDVAKRNLSCDSETSCLVYPVLGYVAG